MNRSTALALLALACSGSAGACQPPRDMPTDAAGQQAYWDRAQTAWEKRVLASASLLVVARVAVLPGDTGSVPSPSDVTRIAFTPVKVLQGELRQAARGTISNHWCDDFKVAVQDKGVYLLAISGERVLMAKPLKADQPQEGVRAFFERIGQANPWQ